MGRRHGAHGGSAATSFLVRTLVGHLATRRRRTVPSATAPNATMLTTMARVVAINGIGATLLHVEVEAGVDSIDGRREASQLCWHLDFALLWVAGLPTFVFAAAFTALALELLLQALVLGEGRL